MWIRIRAIIIEDEPLDSEQVTEAVNRLLAYLRPSNGVTTPDKTRFPATANELLSVKDVDRDRIRLLIFSNYRQLVTRQDAERYWSIRPVQAATNVIPIKAKAGSSSN